MNLLYKLALIVTSYGVMLPDVSSKSPFVNYFLSKEEYVGLLYRKKDNIDNYNSKRNPKEKDF